MSDGNNNHMTKEELDEMSDNFFRNIRNDSSDGAVVDESDNVPPDDDDFQQEVEQEVKAQMKDVKDQVRNTVMDRISEAAGSISSIFSRILSSRLVQDLKTVGVDVSRDYAEDKVARALYKLMWDIVDKYMPKGLYPTFVRIKQADTFQYKVIKTCFTALVFAPLAAVLLRHAEKCEQIASGTGDKSCQLYKDSMRKAKICIFLGRACFRVIYQTQIFDIDKVVDSVVEMLVSKLPDVGKEVVKAADSLSDEEVIDAVAKQVINIDAQSRGHFNNTSKMSRKNNKR